MSYIAQSFGCTETNIHFPPQTFHSMFLLITIAKNPALCERTQHSLFSLPAGAMTSSELRHKLMLEPASSFQYLNQSGCYTLEGVNDAAMFDQLRLALQVDA